jgi:hypothetical protein
MFPIAFAVVPKEDTSNWCWFLTQLKYALGGEQGEFGPYTIMSDRQKVSPICLTSYASLTSYVMVVLLKLQIVI